MMSPELIAALAAIILALIAIFRDVVNAWAERAKVLGTAKIKRETSASGYLQKQNEQLFEVLQGRITEQGKRTDRVEAELEDCQQRHTECEKRCERLEGMNERILARLNRSGFDEERIRDAGSA